ncbi:MAG: hypothetical protein ALECFALPRED_004455 [Alectoria fallacina]|uniref:TM7S3/TM198-like domain-containing protein n=1 Tax=Alectoria fallacina TaxID=1903189 RepID=A0A8H3IWJ7_9LECA|nr:MAG: hypothetical protein ALECFALPRED_004455 [Alectoria fallacina]
MRVYCLYFAISSVLLATNCPTTTAQRYAVLPREANTSTRDFAAASTTSSTTPSSGEATPSASSDGVSSVSGNPSKVTNAAALSSTPLVTATPIAKGSLNVNGTTTPEIEGLPIHPKITPALAVSGPILILTGALYTLIGIKTKWLHIFLSTAYVFALAVSILIEFVMHTPVSNAAQGAYVVAACVTGLIAGGGSLLFKDITEGVSCFLGGFCCSMWVLILRPGGTIPNKTGKIIFISCLTIGASALYISRRTRPYGLIGSTSFGGATAIVLGVDCFSRAGLKEFWLYIWNINNEIFPLLYNDPYPITRGIQVETGAIIIIFAMGITSQLKAWKLIRRRKEEKAKEQRRKNEEGNLADEEHGRRVEDGIKQERGSWEAAYGSGERGKSQNLGYGIGTNEPNTQKGSSGTSDVRNSDPEGLELQEMDALPNGPKKGGRVIVHVIQDDEISPAPSATSENLTRSMRDSREPSIRESQTGASNHFGSATPLGNAAAVRSVDPNLTMEPNITHLPFKVPDLDSRSDGRSSVAASAASEHMIDRWSNRSSGSHIVRKLSKRSQRSFIAASTSEEALMIPDTEDDGASSLAATIDGASEDDDLEKEALLVRDQRPSFEILRKQDPMQALMQGTQRSADLEKDAKISPQQSANYMILGDNQAVQAQHVNNLIDLRPESVALPDSEATSVADAQSTSEQLDMQLKAETASASENIETRPRITSLSGNLPEGASRVITAYRTNEWAKHLEGADLPETDGLNIKKTRAPYSSHQNERTAPVDVHALQQTPLTAEPAPILTVKTHSLGDRPASYFKSKSPSSRQQDTQNLKSAVDKLTPEKAMERTSSQTCLANSMERSPSQSSLSSTQSRKGNNRPPPSKLRSSQASIPSARGFRNNSTPMASSPLVESPIEEGVEAFFPTRFTPSSTHLMSQRDSMLRNKPSSTSLLRTSWSNATLDQHPAFRPRDEDDNIPLSQRKSLLQQNPHSVPQMHRSSSSPILATAAPIFTHNGATTPIQSRNRTSLAPSQPLSGRPSPAPRSSTISAWRASLQASSKAHYREEEIEARRETLLAEKRRESTSRQEQTVSNNRTQNVMDRGMRQSGMIELHQQQMRKMQAEANKSLA